jgi:probable rRNA maturation factor
MDPGSSTPGGLQGSPRMAAGIQDALALAEAEERPQEPEPPGGIEIILAEPGWRRLLPGAEALARRAVRAALADAGAEADGALSVLLADDRTLRRLNGHHRGIAKPTNVLSFPGEAPGHLGDIALALGVVRREAAASGKRPAAHFAHLVAHGTLHLLGHDHLDAGEARRMERAEARAMARLGLPNPWKRAGA